MIENHFQSDFHTNCVITCNTASSKDIKELRYSPLNSVPQCVILSIMTQITCVFESTSKKL